jgi:hypothetical protein
MYCGVLGRLAVVSSLIVLAFCGSAGSASAYSCKPAAVPPAKARSLSGRADCEPGKPKLVRRGDADPMSFVFFMGMVLAVVMVPVALWRRDETPPE